MNCSGLFNFISSNVCRLKITQSQQWPSPVLPQCILSNMFKHLWSWMCCWDCGLYS